MVLHIHISITTCVTHVISKYLQSFTETYTLFLFLTANSAVEQNVVVYNRKSQGIFKVATLSVPNDKLDKSIGNTFSISAKKKKKKGLFLTRINKNLLSAISHTCQDQCGLESEKRCRKYTVLLTH